MSSTTLRFFYCPFPSIEVAREVSQTLLAERLIACANILGAGESMYHWQGHIERSNEVFALLKTTAEKVGSARSRLEQLHPYDVPCIAEIAADSLNVAYAKWLKSAIFEPLPR